MNGEPLNLPRGSVRAALTILLVGAAIASMFLPIVDDQAQGFVLASAALAVQSYFNKRDKQEEQDGPQLPAPHVNEE